MKKLLGILVLGLLLSGNAYSKDKVVLKCDLITDGDNYSQKYSIELNMEKKELSVRKEDSSFSYYTIMNISSLTDDSKIYASSILKNGDRGSIDRYDGYAELELNGYSRKGNCKVYKEKLF